VGLAFKFLGKILSFPASYLELLRLKVMPPLQPFLSIIIA
jgi:hypothetical protein